MNNSYSALHHLSASPVAELVLSSKKTVSVWGGGSLELVELTAANTIHSLHLAKLNPNCHMNYSIIFTEISFYPEN